MQNKPNFLNTKRNVTSVIEKIYRNVNLLERHKNKPNSNPIKTNFSPSRICANCPVYRSIGTANTAGSWSGTYKERNFPEMFFTADKPNEKQFALQILALISFSFSQISPNNRCCRECFYSIVVLNSHRNLNALNIFKVCIRVYAYGSCKDHSGYIIAQQVIAVG